MERIAVIGAGAWGTALAEVTARAGREVVLQAREPGLAETINATQVNDVYLPGVTLDPGIRAVAEPAAAVEGADAVLLVVPAQFVRGVAAALRPALAPGVPVAICAKGIEQGTRQLMSEVLAEALPESPLAVLSGPTFAIEVARGLPAAVTLACGDEAIGRDLADAIGTPLFRAYRSDDVVGAQIGGAVKNVLAIACGIVQGRELGDNARAALITRGLAEMARLGQAKGAKRETLMGLSGIGDLTLTCNAMQSRNFSLGAALGRGRTLDQVLGERKSVAEGVATASSVTELAATLGVDMPICSAVHAIVDTGEDIGHVINELLSRPTSTEF